MADVLAEQFRIPARRPERPRRLRIFPLRPVRNAARVIEADVEPRIDMRLPEPPVAVEADGFAARAFDTVPEQAAADHIDAEQFHPLRMELRLVRSGVDLLVLDAEPHRDFVEPAVVRRKNAEPAANRVRNVSVRGGHFDAVAAEPAERVEPERDAPETARADRSFRAAALHELPFRIVHLELKRSVDPFVPGVPEPVAQQHGLPGRTVERRVIRADLKLLGRIRHIRNVKEIVEQNPALRGFVVAVENRAQRDREPDLLIARQRFRIQIEPVILPAAPFDPDGNGRERAVETVDERKADLARIPLRVRRKEQRSRHGRHLEDAVLAEPGLPARRDRVEMHRACPAVLTARVRNRTEAETERMRRPRTRARAIAAEPA